MLNTSTSLESTLQQVDYKLALNDANLIDAYTSWMEEVEALEESGLVIFTEARKATIGEALKIFIANIVASIQKLKDAIQTEISQRLFSKKYKEHIEKLKKEVLTSEIRHAKAIKMVDFRAACRVYEQMVGELLGITKNILDVKNVSKMHLKKGIDEYHDNLDEFYAVADRYDAKLESIFEHEVDVPINDVIRFIEQESNNGPLLKSLDTAMRSFKEMESEVKALETKESIVGEQLMSSKAVTIRRTSNKVMKMIRKWIAKIIGKCVFYFA